MAASSGGSDALEARRDAGATVGPGLVAGVLGGLAMAASMMASAALEGADPLAPLWPIGDAFSRGPPDRSAGTFLFGVALHLAFAGALGILFTALLPRDFRPTAAGVVCTGLAVLTMALMTTVVLPAVNPTLRAEMPAFGGAWVAAHAVYGFTTGYCAQLIRGRGQSRLAHPLRARHA